MYGEQLTSDPYLLRTIVIGVIQKQEQLTVIAWID
jgi:hypothetical protein